MLKRDFWFVLARGTLKNRAFFGVFSPRKAQNARLNFLSAHESPYQTPRWELRNIRGLGRRVPFLIKLTPRIRIVDMMLVLTTCLPVITPKAYTFKQLTGALLHSQNPAETVVQTFQGLLCNLLASRVFSISCGTDYHDNQKHDLEP